ncbi:Subtilisin protease SBT4.14 [Spatholobus suberectus]|nr:Subtilisin protease SBT4.14 [Spatholobus suberectus]
MALAGNDGPTMGTVTNTAPWIVTIAASDIERAFKSTVRLGNGKNVSPDVAAPGIDILTSNTFRKSLTGLKGDTQFSEFILLSGSSGTSMACLLVAGVAPHVKSFYPYWTPAAIRSTTITAVLS